MKRASDFANRALLACTLRPRLALTSPWWDSLSKDFAREPDPFAFRTGERLQVGFTAASDVVLRTMGACLVGSLALPLGYHPVGLYRGLRDRRFYADLAASGDSSRVFIAPPRAVKMSRRRARMPLFSPDDGVCEDVRFESPFMPLNPNERDRYLAHSANRFAHARHWRHHKGPRATVVAIHGFSADLYHFNEWFFSIRWLYEAGFDVLLVTLPFHGARQSMLAPFSGHGLFAGGTNVINEALAQAVFDIRIYVGALLDAGVPRVGVTGMSLGGLTASLVASAEDRLSFAIPNVPVVSLADLVLEWEPIASFVKLTLAASFKDIRTLRQMLAISCPLAFQPKLPRERLFIIGGAGDRLAPPRHARLLWDHWARPRMHWFPGSHVLHLDRGQYFRAMKAFFGDIGFVP
jgi:pimeloyl-ACP methyl ester carboxylesterase